MGKAVLRQPRQGGSSWLRSGPTLRTAPLSSSRRCSDPAGSFKVQRAWDPSRCSCPLAEIERLTIERDQLIYRLDDCNEWLQKAVKEQERLRGIIEDEAKEWNRRGFSAEAKALRDRVEESK